jgi:hypothetical protein
MGYTVFYRRLFDAKVLRSVMSRWSIGRGGYGFWDRLWIGMVDLFGVWWLIRRKNRVPQSVEVTLAR